jgi:plastocyanin domain-containing protein
MGPVSKRFVALLVATLLVGGALVVLTFWPAPVAPPPSARSRAPEVRAGPDNRVELSVTEHGFEPSPVHVSKGLPVTLVVTRTTDQTCATELIVPGTEVNVPLPLGIPVTITFVPPKSGALRYGCAMQMMVSGVLIVD